MVFGKNKTEGSEKQQVEKRREEVLARGRKFKYPLQYAKHKLITFSVALAVILGVFLVFVGYSLLYKIQNTGDVIYRISRVVPVPVAKVDDESVRFSDYLMFYRSSIKVVEKQSGDIGEGEDADALREQYKRAALDEVEKLTFAQKIAKETNISVSKEEIAEEFEKHKKVGGADRSEEAFLKLISENFGLSKSDYERMLRLQILKAKVAYEIDEEGKNTVSTIEKMIGDGKSFEDIRNTLGEKISYEETGGLVSNKNIDGGRSDVAFVLNPGEVSQKFVSSNGDGIYFVKLIEKDEGRVNYASIKVMLTEFDKRFGESKELIKEYIEVSKGEN